MRMRCFPPLKKRKKNGERERVPGRRPQRAKKKRVDFIFTGGGREKSEWDDLNVL